LRTFREKKRREEKEEKKQARNRKGREATKKKRTFQLRHDEVHRINSETTDSEPGNG
jgi:hypothetical protein